MKEKKWSYSELEKEAIKDFKRSEVDMIMAGSRSTVNWRLNEQEKDAIAKMYQEEHDFLMQALKKHGIELDIDQEQKRRFKTLSIEIQNLPHGGRVKRFYYNDGSIDGLLVLEYDVQRGYKFDVTTLKGKMSPMKAEDIDKQIDELRNEWERKI